MNELITEMPYIFNVFEDSGLLFSKNKNRAVGIVGISSACEVNEMHEIRKINVSKKIFGSNSTISQLCDIALKNGAPKVIAIAVDNSYLGYEYGFSLLEDVPEVSVIICDNETVDVSLLLKDSVEAASQDQKERMGIVSISNASDKIACAENFDCERIIIVAQDCIDNEMGNGCLLTAALAGIIAGSEEIIIPFKNIKLSGISAVFEDLSSFDVNSYLNAGITPFEYENSQLKPIKVINSKGTPNDVNTILTIDYVINSLRTCLKSMFEGEYSDSLLLSAIKTQTQILLEDFLNNGIINNFSISEIALDENNICNVKIEFTPITLVNQLSITANIRL